MKKNDVPPSSLNLLIAEETARCARLAEQFRQRATEALEAAGWLLGMTSAQSPAKADPSVLAAKASELVRLHTELVEA